MAAQPDAGAISLCWFFAVCFAFDELFHLLRTLYLIVHCKLHKKAETLSSHELSWFLIALSSVVFVNAASKAQSLPRLPALICIGGWLFIPLCVMIQKNLVSKKSWPDFLEGGMDGFFSALEDLRNIFLQLEKFAKRNRFKIFWGLFAVYACLIPAYVYLQLGNDWWFGVLFPVLLTYLLYSACTALHSGHSLLRFWFVHGLLLACFIVSLMSEASSSSSFSKAGIYIVFVCLLSVIWIIIAGIANDDVAKMTAAVVNTGTTIFAILINVLAGWGMNCWKYQAPYCSLLEQLQFYGNLILLPLIVSGYLSALLKEMQLYRRTHR